MSRRLKGLFRLTPLRVSVSLSVLLTALYIVNPPILELFELKAYDFRLRWRGDLSTTGQVVIIGVDEKSLETIGQWPWSRIVLAQLIEVLTQAGARVIGLDFIWPEPERRGGVLDSLYGDSEVSNQVPVLRDLQGRLRQVAKEHPEMDSFLREISNAIHPDEIFAQAISESHRVVIGDFFFMDAGEVPHVQVGPRKEDMPLLKRSAYPVVRKPRSLASVPFLPKPYLIKGNIPVIAKSARALGYFNMIPDTDGVVRLVPLVMEYQGDYLPPLSLQALRYAGAPSQLVLHLKDYGVAEIQWGKRRVPITERGMMYINYRGGYRTFPYISAVDVLKGSISLDEIKDKIVLVGAVATGTYDLRVTPLASVFPGVEVHANVIDNILQGDFIFRPEWATLIDISLLLGLGIGLGWFFPKMRPVPGAVLMVLVFGGQLYANTWVLIRWGYWLNVIYPSILIPLGYLGVSIYKYILEEREKRKIKGAFQYYVTPSVVNQILKDPEALKLGGEEKVLTVLFCDIRGFTSISEALPPEELVRLLNEYFTQMTNVVFRNRGTLDKYIGDAIMAFYGAPLPLEDHPYRACSTALDMREELKKLRVGSEPRGMGSLDIGIGINTGEMVVGNMGSQRRFDYTVMGDHVNLASRLEGLNKQYGTHVIMSEFTYSQVGEHLLCRELDWVRVKGKARPVQIYELLGRRSQKEDDRLWLEAFTRGLAHYRNLEFDHAEECFQDVLKRRPDDQPSMLYLERCEHLRATTIPPGWDGVFEWETK